MLVTSLYTKQIQFSSTFGKYFIFLIFAAVQKRLFLLPLLIDRFPYQREHGLVRLKYDLGDIPVKFKNIGIGLFRADHLTIIVADFDTAIGFRKCRALFLGFRRFQDGKRRAHRDIAGIHPSASRPFHHNEISLVDYIGIFGKHIAEKKLKAENIKQKRNDFVNGLIPDCLLYTSDAADDQ